jgi:hypothetical protein
VTFDFSETVAIEPGYTLHEPYHATAAVELVEVLVDEPRRVVLQHLLVGDEGVVKHWRQDWTYENADLYEYAGDRTWRHRRLPAEDVRGTWTQSVYQVDDSPRYTSNGRWVHGDGLSSWESDWTWRPLPRRELTKRDDYDVLIARNRHTLTHTGWIHEQDNYKLVLRDGARKVLVRETGINRYDHVDPVKADAARGYWGRTRDFWAVVRSAWDELLVPGANIKLHAKIEDKTLWKSMFELAEEHDSSSGAPAAAEVRKVLDRYRMGATEATANGEPDTRGHAAGSRATLGGTP